MTADWWTALHSAFAGSDDSLHMDEIIEELEGVEQRRYLSIKGGTDLSRAEFEERETKAGLALNPPPGVEPLDHWRNKLKKDQGKNNPDPQRRGLEIVTAKDVGISEEEKKEYSADLVRWGKARREADEVINQELLAELVERRKARRDKDSSIDSPTVDLSQVHFDKTVGIALKHGVSPQLILIMRNAKQMLKKESCILPKVAEASAAFCSRLAVEARKLERLRVRGEVSAANRGNGTTHLQGQEKKKPKHLLMPTKATPQERAMTVARIIAELNGLKPQMYGEQCYEELRDSNGDFLSFQIAEQRNDLKLKLVHIQESKRHIRLAQELAAHFHGIQLPTMKSDWKHHKAENFRTKKPRKTRRKKRKKKA